MEPLEFVEKQIDINKDVLKVLKISEEQIVTQNKINHVVAEHIDRQAARIKTLEQIIYITIIATIFEVIALAVLIATK